MYFRSHGGLTCFYMYVVRAIPKYAILRTRKGIKIWEIDGATRFEVTALWRNWSENKSPVFTVRELSTLSCTSYPIPKNWDEVIDKYFGYVYRKKYMEKYITGYSYSVVSPVMMSLKRQFPLDGQRIRGWESTFNLAARADPKKIHMNNILAIILSLWTLSL